MKFKLIAAVNDRLALGKDGDTLYHIKSDLKNFKRMTIDNVVIMGRKTFESLPNGPLPNRVNIIISSQKNYSVDSSYTNVYIAHSIDDAVELCEALFNDKECFVIGGATIYQAFLEMGLIDIMYITSINDDAEGDTYFPNVFEDWRLFYESYTQRQRTDEITYKFAIYHAN